MELKVKSVAVVCDYQLNENRIGGMDRFFKAYDKACKRIGLSVDWFFPESQPLDFYCNMQVYSGPGAVEEYFIHHIHTKRKHYDVVMTHFLALCTSFYKRVKSMNNPYIIAVDHNPRPLNGFPLKKRLKNKIKGRFFGPHIDCLIGVSQYTVNNITKDYGSHLWDKTEVIYNGIDASLYQKKYKENKGKFIVASHLRESKGLQDLIEAVHLLADPYKEMLEIDIFGEGPFEQELKDQVEKYELQQQIRFKGSTRHLPKLFQNYSYMLQPTYMECFSLSILESLAANVPVITTPVGGNLEVIEHSFNGFIFPQKDVFALKELLEHILSGSLEIKAEVYSLVEEKYSLQQMVENYIKVLSL